VAAELTGADGEFPTPVWRMLAGGCWVPAASGMTFPAVDPATGREVARVPLGGAEDIDRAVAGARRAFDEGPWRLTTAGERGEFLLRLADLVEEHGHELAEIEALDSGKPPAVIQTSCLR
jgi:phenylacetaldehyde dehydrogenase